MLRKLISLFFYQKNKNTKEQITDFLQWCEKHCSICNNCVLHHESKTHYMFNRSEMITDNKFCPNDKHISELYDVFLQSKLS
jgi:hypothetical protein